MEAHERQLAETKRKSEGADEAYIDRINNIDDYISKIEQDILDSVDDFFNEEIEGVKIVDLFNDNEAVNAARVSLDFLFDQASNMLEQAKLSREEGDFSKAETLAGMAQDLQLTFYSKMIDIVDDIKGKIEGEPNRESLLNSKYNKLDKTEARALKDMLGVMRGVFKDMLLRNGENDTIEHVLDPLFDAVVDVVDQLIEAKSKARKEQLKLEVKSAINEFEDIYKSFISDK